MHEETAGKSLFIVDNSVSGWTALRYLKDWASIAKSFDIATGYFEIGSLLALDGHWQPLEKIRILLGAEMTGRTRKALLEAIKKQTIEILDISIEGTKSQNPFLTGVPAILKALRSGQIECRVYDKDKFHAKAYITHAKMEVIGSQALVGSSNFTFPGLTENIELNIQIQSAREVAQLQEWFEIHWNEASEVTDAVIEAVDRQTKLYTPYDVYTKALYEYFRDHELTDTEWDETRSKMFHRIDRYQKEAYWAMMKIARQHGGAFLCDGVGLGKTFVGLMLIERLVLHDGKRVVLFAPKAAKEGVWDRHLKEWLPHIGGGSDFSNLAVFSHTDLNRKGDFPERFKRIGELADVIIIDEAHHFRNQGNKGSEDEGVDSSRYYKLYEMLDSSQRPKVVFMLTATPINNRMSDFRHMAELFTRGDEAYFASTLGINNLRAHFNQVERKLKERVGHDIADISEFSSEAQQVLEADEIFRHLVVQRSRAYARESQIRETGKAAMFPDRKAPQVASYSIKKSYGKLLEMFERAFTRSSPLFTLPMYYPLAWYKGSDTNINPLDEGRQEQIVGLIRTNFLKRFESSVVAFEMSCNRLLRKLLAFIEIHSETVAEKNRYKRWLEQNSKVLGFATQRDLALWNNDDLDSDDDDDIVPMELLLSVNKLARSEYKVEEMLSETFLDLDQIVQFLLETQKFLPKNDDKLQKLIRLLNTKELLGEKVLLFTEFADTARYLKRELEAIGITGVGQVDSSTKGSRADVIQQFAPYYNGTSSGELVEKGKTEIRVLISTDVLSEGLNLQDASRMINYDIHWNPVRLMQRIGRVDRRMSPITEERLIKDHPGIEKSRGKISFWNFLPPDELNSILSLYSTVTKKTLMISKALGIEGKKLLTPQDDYDPLKEFNSAYEGTRTAIEDLHLELQDLLDKSPEMEDRLKSFPGSLYSGRKKAARHATGVFFCYSLPALDKEVGEFTYEAGSTKWYLYDIHKKTILEEAGDIASHIRSLPETPRICNFVQEELIDIRSKLDKHIKNSYLKRVNAPVGVNPKLRCWMELNEG